MNPTKAIGLGEPEVVGKRSLFQPPTLTPKKPKEEKVLPVKAPQVDERRIRTTLEVSLKSLGIIQEIQGKHRMETGHPLPKWKIIDEALDVYEKIQKGEGNDKERTDSSKSH